VLNLELGANDEIVRLATRVRPFQATLVPEKRQEITTEGGLALRKTDRRLQHAIARLTKAGIRVSLFIDPALNTIDVARELGVPAIELHTGAYANASKETANERPRTKALQELRQAATHARNIGLAVHAGHGLTYHNVQPVAAIPEIEELNIGHSIVSRAMFVGLAEAVREMRAVMDVARTRG
jgi:pyridoxine 5-phosphate synthase